MKLLLACALIAFCGLGYQKPCVCLAADSTYAQILPGAVLYLQSDGTQPVTSLPETYFVTVLDYDQQFSRVSYKNLTGYVSSSLIEPSGFTPAYLYADARLTLTNDGGVINVRSSPDHTLSNVTEKLTDGVTLEYYGEVEGSAQNQIIGTKWYAVALSGGKIGYVYSMYAVAEQIKDNVILPAEQVEGASVETSLTPTRSSSYFLIGAMCMPVIVVTYLLFKQKPTER